MKKKILIVLCVVIALVVYKKYTWGTWRYKMTVVIETPEGIKTGFAVRETHAYTIPAPWEISGIDTEKTVTGEAVVVDLGKRGVLFAILGVNGSHEIIYQAFPSVGAPLSGKGIKYYDGLYEKIGDRKVVLNRSMDDYPPLVTFTDINDPMTVRGVPREKLDDVFGDGVKLREIYIQMTDEPVTWGIEKKLKWLKIINGNYLHGEITSRNAPLGLHGGNFKRGKK